MRREIAQDCNAKRWGHFGIDVNNIATGLEGPYFVKLYTFSSGESQLNSAAGPPENYSLTLLGMLVGTFMDRKPITFATSSQKVLQSFHRFFKKMRSYKSKSRPMAKVDVIYTNTSGIRRISYLLFFFLKLAICWPFFLQRSILGIAAQFYL